MNTETLDRPEVADELVDVADISGGRAVVKLNRTEAALRELRADLEGKTYDLATTAGDRAARADRLRCVTLRTTLEKRRKELKAPALEFGRQIDAAAERIKGAILVLEGPIDAAIQADERRRAEEKAARERAEAERLQALRDTVDQSLGKWTARAMAPDMTAARIEAGIKAFCDLAMPEELRDVAAHWDVAKRSVLVELERLQAKAQQREEAARVEAQRLENDRIAAEQRAEAQRQAAEIARQRAELEALAAAQRAQAEQIERERKALIEQQMRALDQAEDRAIPNPQPAADTPAPQQEVGQNLPQPQPGLTLSPGDAAVEPAGAEAVAAADDAPASNVTVHEDAPQQTTEQAARALLDHIALAFTGRFPSDPKPGRAWFATLKHLAFNLNDTI